MGKNTPHPKNVRIGWKGRLKNDELLGGLLNIMFPLYSAWRVVDDLDYKTSPSSRLLHHRANTVYGSTHLLVPVLLL